jgi:ubiquinone/menaquinone biosynthesis C-methylase UbiE
LSHFDHVANEWDSEGKISLMSALADKVNSQLNLSTKLDILDFGCGTGLFGLAFHDKANQLVGVDTSEGMLAMFKDKTKAYDNISSQNVNLENGELPSGQYDLILSSMAFHHLQSPSDVLGRLGQILRDQGRIAVIDLESEDGSFHPDPEAMGVKHFGFSFDEVSSWATEHQFKVEVKTINEMEKDSRMYKQFLAIFSK